MGEGVTALCADIRLNLQVNPLMDLQVAELVEALLTPAAPMLSLHQMITPHVILQDGLNGVPLVTHGTDELRGVGVHGELVTHQRAFPGECLPAELA